MVEAGNSIVSNNINLSHCTVFHKGISMLSNVVQILPVLAAPGRCFKFPIKHLFNIVMSVPCSVDAASVAGQSLK